MTVSRHISKKIVTFLALTFGISSISYLYMVSTGSAVNVGPLWMWSPGLAAVITQVLFRGRLRDFGWALGEPRYLLTGYAVPWLYASAIYVSVWFTGLGEFSARSIVLGGHPVSPFISLLASATIGLIPACLVALGEEIGWRGLLVPELAKITTFTRTALLTGIIWAVWHYPGVIFAEYHSSAPRWFDLLNITISVLGMSVFTAWLRVKSGSIWPAVLWHGNHNLLIQSVFLRMTADTGLTHYFVDDFGLGVLLSSIAMGCIFWRKRTELVEETTAGDA